MGGRNLSKGQLKALSGLPKRDFDNLWTTAMDFLKKEPSTSLLLRGPGSKGHGLTNSEFNSALAECFDVIGVRQIYSGNEAGRSLSFPGDEKQIMSFFQRLIVTQGGCQRGNRKKRERTVSQRPGQPAGTSSSNSVTTSTKTMIETNPHAPYITNSDECDDRVFEAILEEKPVKFLIAPLSITFEDFSARCHDTWGSRIIDKNGVKCFNILIGGSGEYPLEVSKSSVAEDWKKVMGIAEDLPNSTIQVSVEFAK